jgi:hypothetical protein
VRESSAASRAHASTERESSAASRPHASSVRAEQNVAGKRKHHLHDLALTLGRSGG